MQQGIKKLQWLQYLKVVFLEILNALLCQVFANQVTYVHFHNVMLLQGRTALADCKESKTN